MKRYSIDGLPGFTMQGKKGKTGERGCMTFCNVMNTYTLSKNYNYSIGIALDNNDAITPIVFPSNKIEPIKGDYVIDVLQSISNLYVIDDIIEFTKEELTGVSEESNEYNNVDEDIVFKLDISTTLNSVIKEFADFVKTLSDKETYKIFKLSLLNSWLYKQGLSSKDTDLSISTQSFSVYKTPWKGEYTPRYLNKEISYVSSPYTPFAHVKNGVLVEDNMVYIPQNLSESDSEIELFKKYPSVYRNIGSLSSYYTDIFEYSLDELGYVISKSDNTAIHPWLDVQLSGEEYYNIDNQITDETIGITYNECVGVIISNDGSYSKKEGNLLNLTEAKVLSESEKEIIQNINASKKDDSENSEPNKFEYKNEIVNYIGNNVFLIQKTSSSNKQENGHYLSFLKVNLFNSLEIKNKDEIEKLMGGGPGENASLEEIEEYAEKLVYKNKEYVINTDKVNMKSDSTLSNYDIINVANNLEFFHDSISAGTKKKINATIFLGKNHFNYNQINKASKNLITSTYFCKTINRELVGSNDTYTFGGDCTIEVYDVDNLEINDFSASDNKTMSSIPLVISDIYEPLVKFKYSTVNTTTTSHRIFGNNYLDFLLNDTNNRYFCYSSNTNVTLIGFIEQHEETSEESSEEFSNILPLTLNELFVGIHIIKINKNEYSNKTVDISFNNKQYINFPYIEYENDSDIELIDKKIFRIFNNLDDDTNYDVKTDGDLIVKKDGAIKYSSLILDDLGSYDNTYGIIVSIYGYINKPNCDFTTITPTFSAGSDNSLELICESNKIFKISDLFKLFSNENNLNIPFNFLCNTNTFDNPKFSSFGYDVSSSEIYPDANSGCKIYINNDFIQLSEDVVPEDSETINFSINENENNEEQQNIHNRVISYNNITQCIEIKGLETDNNGILYIPIISTKPIINDEEENNVFAYLKLTYNDYSISEKAYLNHPFFESKTIIDKMFYNKDKNILNCYLLPRNFYSENDDITDIKGVLLNQISNKINYLNATNYYWNEYITPYELINDRTTYAEQTGPIPIGGFFKVINGNILFYDTDSPSLQEQSNRLKRYNILLDVFNPKSEEDMYIDESSEEDEEDPEEEIKDVEELIDFHNSKEVEKIEYTLTQFIVHSSLKPDVLKNVKIEVELFNNIAINVKNISSCVDNMWETKKYTDSIEFNNKSLPQNCLMEVLYDLYMRDVHNSTSVITDNTSYIADLKNNYNTLTQNKSLPYLKSLEKENDEGIYKNRERTVYNKTKIFYAGLETNKDNNILKDAYTSNIESINKLTPDTRYLYSRIGWSKNYDNTLNFDNENIFPCTFVIKNYNETFNNGMFSSTIMIPKELTNECSMKIYAYIKNNSSSATKILLGQTTLNATY